MHNRSEEALMFKAYLRTLLRQYGALREALARGDRAAAEALLDALIEDTRKTLEN